MSNKTLLIDCDEVLLGWFPIFKQHAERELGKTFDTDPKDFDLSIWLGISKKESHELVYDFNDNHEHFENLLPILESEVYLPKIKELGFNLVVITACSSKASTATKRIKNLVNVYGDIFSTIYCVGNSEEKKKHLSEFDASYWIEDRVENALVGKELGHTPIIIRQSHNLSQESRYPELSWVDNWEEIYNILKDTP